MNDIPIGRRWLLISRKGERCHFSYHVNSPWGAVVTQKVITITSILRLRVEHKILEKFWRLLGRDIELLFSHGALSLSIFGRKFGKTYHSENIVGLSERELPGKAADILERKNPVVKYPVVARFCVLNAQSRMAVKLVTLRAWSTCQQTGFERIGLGG